MYEQPTATPDSNRLPPLSRTMRRMVNAIALLTTMVAAGAAHAAVDLVINIDSDKPAYKSTDTQTFTVSISNNGPGAAVKSLLTINHPAAGAPFQASATCVASGGAVCPSSYAGLPSNNLTATLPSIPSQGLLVIRFMVIPPLVCRQGATLDCGGGLQTYDVGRKLITASVTNTATDGLAVTNLANTNIALYAPTIGYKVAITNAPVGPLVPGSIVAYDLEVTSLGQDPSGPLRLSAAALSQIGSQPAGTTNSFLPGTEIVSLVCLSATPAPGPALPNTVFLGGNSCPASINIPTPGPTTVTNNLTDAFPTTALLNLPGTDLGGGVATFRATVKVGTPRCVASGAVDRPLKFSFGVVGPTESSPFTGVDNTASATNSVNGACLQADIESKLTLTPTSIVATTPGSNSYVMTATIKNLSTGAGSTTANNVVFNLGTGQHPFFLGPITVSAITCAASGAAMCPAASANTVSPSGASTAYVLSGVIPSLPPGDGVTLTVTVTAGAVQPVCNYSAASLTVPFVQALPDPAVADPNYSAVLPALGNNRDEKALAITANGSNPSATSCTGSSPPTALNAVTVVKTGPFTTAGGSTATGQSSGAFVAPGTTVWYRLVVTNVGTIGVDLRRLQDTATGPTTALSTGGFQGTGTTLAGWGAMCSATAGATCFTTVTTTPSAYGSGITMQYAGGATVPLPTGAGITVDVPYIVPQPALSTVGVCTAQIFNGASVSYDYGGTPASVSAVSSPFIYTGYPSCNTALSITKTINAPASTTSIPPSGIISYTLLLQNLSTTASISRPRLQDVPTLNAANSATISSVTITCAPTSGAAVCPPASSLVAGSQMPSGTAINASAIDIEWGTNGANTLPPGSAVTFTVTLQLSTPTPAFSGLSNVATFRADNEPLFWAAKLASVFTNVPTAPIISVQKRVAAQILGYGGVAQYTVDVINVGGSPATNVAFIDALPASLSAANPAGYSAVTCTNISATMPTPVGSVTCPTPTGNATGLNFTIPSLPANTALRFMYNATMPNAELSTANFVSVSPQAANGTLAFSGGAAGAHANVQVLAPAPVQPPAPAMVPTLNGAAQLLLALLIAGFAAWPRSLRTLRHRGQTIFKR